MTDARDTGATDLSREDVLGVLADATDDAMWLSTADWEEVVFVNDACEDVFGVAVEQFREDPTAFGTTVHQGDREAVEEMMEAVSAGESRELEVRAATDSDDDRWVRIQARPVTDDGTVTHVAGFARDVTERKRRERQLQDIRRELEESNERLQRFAYVVSHDLQEPLRMVSSYVSLLETEYRDELDEEAEEYIDYAVDGADRMKALIDGLLEFSRVESRGDEMTTVDAEAVLEEVLQALEMRIAETDAAVETGSLPTVTADRAQLSQVFQNLVENAIDYAGDDPPVVRVRGEKRDGEYVFAVEDEGVGIPEDQQDDIFDIFQRGHNVDGDGIGVGLAISQRIVDRHGGEMWVDSAEGEGTTVYFSLAKEPEEGEGPRL